MIITYDQIICIRMYHSNKINLKIIIEEKQF